jgi:hypothetical protein
MPEFERSFSLRFDLGFDDRQEAGAVGEVA